MTRHVPPSGLAANVRPMPDAAPIVRDPDLMSAREIADELHVAERTVRRWVSSGRLPANRRGRAIEVSLVGARRLLEESARSQATRQNARLSERAEQQRAELGELLGRYREVAERLTAAEEELAAARITIALFERDLTQRAA